MSTPTKAEKTDSAKRSSPIIKLIVIALLLLILAATATISGLYYQWSRRSLPQLDGEIPLTGLKQDVIVRRDKFGVPYITAQTDEDLMFAEGYVTAQDRLWQIDLIRRAAGGRMSEVLGSDQLEFDKRQRSFGFRRAAERTLRSMNPDDVVTLTSFARGVNAYIEEHRDNLPLEFHILQYEPEPWKPVDTLLVDGLMSEMLSTSWDRDAFRGQFADKLDAETKKYLYPEFTVNDQILVGSDGTPLPGEIQQAPARKTVSPAAPAMADLFEIQRKTFAALGLDADLPGSNNWVISGKKTTTGKPILANDPHLGHAIPSIWYQIELESKESGYHAAGVTLPGTPGIVIGHNDRIAWGVTNYYADVQDLYYEEMNPQNLRQYKVGNEWRDAEIIREPIKVRRSLRSTATDTVDFAVTITRHGPIVSDTGGKKLALHWNTLDDINGFSAFASINRAKNWDEFKNALKLYPGPAQNFIFADMDGNIGYHVAANIPIRKSGDGTVPYDGTTDDGEWLSNVPFDELPQSYNPEVGWIATANNRTTGKDYKHMLGHEWSSPYRAMRINELIRTHEKLSVDDVRAIQADIYSIPDVEFAKAVERILKSGPKSSDPNADELLKTVENWDGKLSPDSVKATIISATRESLTAKIIRGKFGKDADKYTWYNQTAGISQILYDKPTSMLPSGVASYDELIIQSYKDALADLTSRFGSDKNKWQWGDAHALVFKHPLGLSLLKSLLNAPPIKMGGGGSTVNAYGYTRASGVSMRMIVDLSDLDNSSQNITVGESGQNSSPYYSDQIADWVSVTRHIFPFTEAAVEKAKVHLLTLKPR